MNKNIILIIINRHLNLNDVRIIEMCNCIIRGNIYDKWYVVYNNNNNKLDVQDSWQMRRGRGRWTKCHLNTCQTWRSATGGGCLLEAKPNGNRIRTGLCTIAPQPAQQNDT